MLCAEVIDGLHLQDGQVVVDGTLGLGGYTEAVLNTGKIVKVVAFDLDLANLNMAKERLSGFADQVTFVHDNFANVKAVLAEHGLSQVNAIMLDLGLSSPQVDEAGRGFSFAKDGPLDMRFNKSQKLTAAIVVNTYDAERLADIFYRYADEKKARQIARAIVLRRSTQLFENTLDLAQVVVQAIPFKGKTRIHPATKVFQALRMEVNSELANLQQVLVDSLDVLAGDGHLAVVSYHSLEDGMVKNFFREMSKSYVNLPDQLTTTYLEPRLKILTKKPIVPGVAEVHANPRARSAKLRIAQKI